jgi:hypothetical protein
LEELAEFRGGVVRGVPEVVFGVEVVVVFDYELALRLFPWTRVKFLPYKHNKWTCS